MIDWSIPFVIHSAFLCLCLRNLTIFAAMCFVLNYNSPNTDIKQCIIVNIGMRIWLVGWLVVFNVPSTELHSVRQNSFLSTKFCRDVNVFRYGSAHFVAVSFCYNLYIYNACIYIYSI